MKRVPEELLTVDQVAAELQLHPDTIRRFIREGKIKAVKISTTVVRVKRSELDKFIEDRSTDQPEK